MNRTTLFLAICLSTSAALALDDIDLNLEDFTTTDETYLMKGPTGESRTLLTTDHPRSMREIAWTRANGDSRVFCLQLGHDSVGWASSAEQSDQVVGRIHSTTIDRHNHSANGKASLFSG